MLKMLEHIPLGDRESFIGSPTHPPFFLPLSLPPPELLCRRNQDKKATSILPGDKKKNKHTGNTPWSLAEYKAVIQQRSNSLNDSREPALNNTAAEMMGGREKGRKLGGREYILMSSRYFPLVMPSTIVSERRKRKGNGLVILQEGENTAK